MAVITAPTVYDCGTCATPIHWVENVGWRHANRSPACPHQEPVSVDVPLPVRREP